jgi:hypothetical protein
VLKNKETGELLSASAVTIERRGLDPWTLYLYAMKSPATKEKYLMRLGKFLNFLNIQEGDILEDKSRIFAKKGRDDNIWAFNSILSFIQLLKERVDRKEITAGTICNYVKSIKLFCQMADISISWEKITRGIPKGRRYANPAKNSPTIIATNLITFFKAYPIRIPTKKPQPRIAAVGAKLSIMVIILDATP